MTRQEMSAIIRVLGAARDVLADYDGRVLQYECDSAMQRLVSAMAEFDDVLGRAVDDAMAQ